MVTSRSCSQGVNRPAQTVDPRHTHVVPRRCSGVASIEYARTVSPAPDDRIDESPELVRIPGFPLTVTTNGRRLARPNQARQREASRASRRADQTAGRLPSAPVETSPGAAWSPTPNPVRARPDAVRVVLVATLLHECTMLGGEGRTRRLGIQAAVRGPRALDDRSVSERQATCACRGAVKAPAPPQADTQRAPCRTKRASRRPSGDCRVDEEQERTVGLLLLGKGAVLAHGFDRPLAVEMDEDEASTGVPSATSSLLHPWRAAAVP
jgi:hypothetical protein